MKESQPNLISEEQKRIQKNMEVVEATEGFSYLTEKQQRIIKQSLYLQVRAERGRKEWQPGETRKYKNTEDYVDNRNCHSAVFFLEKENLQEISENARDDSDFFKAEYVVVKEINALKKQIEEFGFPCVLHIGNSPSQDPSGKAHSSLVLGHNKEGEIILWEKESYDILHPYQVTTLDQIYRTYGDICSYYGLRKLRNGIKDLPESKIN